MPITSITGYCRDSIVQTEPRPEEAVNTHPNRAEAGYGAEGGRRPVHWLTANSRSLKARGSIHPAHAAAAHPPTTAAHGLASLDRSARRRRRKGGIFGGQVILAAGRAGHGVHFLPSYELLELRPAVVALILKNRHIFYSFKRTRLLLSIRQPPVDVSVRCCSRQTG